MFRTLLYAFACISLSTELTFKDFTKTFNKKYASVEEYFNRRKIFMSNYNNMLKHNKDYAEGKVSWKKKVTEYFDMTLEEKRSQLNFGLPPINESLIHDHIVGGEMGVDFAESLAPDSWNWLDRGAVSPIKDQKKCGSCAVFAAVAAAESCMWIATNYQNERQNFFINYPHVDLSEQHLMDCAYGHTVYDFPLSFSNKGCHGGGYAFVYYDWIIKNNDERLEKEDCAPYQGRDRSCVDDDSCNYPHARLTGYWHKFHTTEDELKELVYKAPVLTSIDASSIDGYETGVYDDSDCCDDAIDPHCTSKTRHEVTVIGYGSELGKDYWLVKNSWGIDHNVNGYIKIKRGTGHCGIGYHGITQPRCAADQYWK